MAIRVYPNLSPRLIEVLSPDTSITIQELHNELQDWMDEPASMSYPNLVLTSGKESLGGGVLVGLTCELQNAQLFFTPRTTPASTGTATSTDTTTLTDTAATFITDGVSRGDIIHNHAGKSSATVITVDSETQVTHTALEGTVTSWAITDSYDIFNIIQCNVFGGNLVAIDGVGAELDPIFPSAYTQVIRTSSSSATLQELSSIQYASFNNGVTMDNVNGVDSTTFPAGTAEAPVKTLVTAQTIAASRGFSRIYIRGDYTFLTTDSVDNYIIEGENPTLSTFVLTGAASITNSTIVSATISGELDGGNTVHDCNIGTLTYIDGSVRDCELQAGTITLNGAQAEFIRCWSGVAGSNTPLIDMNGTGTDLLVREYSGGLQLNNHTSGSDNISLDFNSGHIILDSTITAGEFTVRGIAKLTDKSSGTAVINSSDLLVPARLTNLQQLVEGLRPGHPATGNVWFWDPCNGSDSNSGLTAEQAVQSFNAAQDLVTDNNHDVIIALSTDPSGVTIVTEPIKVTKSWLFIRGSGIDFVIRPTTTTVNTALVDFDGTTGGQITGVVIDGTSVAGTGLLLNTDEASVDDIRIENITGDGLCTEHCSTTYIRNLYIKDVTGDGIRLHNCTSMDIERCTIQNATNGFYSTADTLGQGGSSSLRETTFLGCATGVNIGTNVTDTQIYETCAFAGNVTTTITDNGTNTLIEGNLDATVIAGAVWDEAYASHTTDGTFGGILTPPGGISRRI